MDAQGAVYLDAMRLIGEVEDEVSAEKRKAQPKPVQGAQ